MGEKKCYLSVVVIQLIYTGMFLVSKAVFDGGMNTYIFVFYRQAAGTLFLVPFAFFVERKDSPPLSFLTFCKIFGLSLLGITTSLNIHGIALKYTSASLAAAASNCLPALTFFMAFLLRMESVNVRRSSGVAKISGIVVCMAGAATMAFYRGPEMRLLLHHHLLSPTTNTSHPHDDHQASSTSSTTWILGVFLLLFSITCWSIWIVLQARVLKSYPSKLSFTALQCLLSSLQSFVVAIIMEREAYQWKLGLNIRLLAVAYCGFVVTGLAFYLQTWVIQKKGPVFLGLSTPLAFIFTTVSAALLLGEILSLGSIIGGILLIGGLYFVLWGKSKEEEIGSSNLKTTPPPTIQA
ncbi:WAT1-related protein At5g64700 [Rutidosis leptorrhynchoides]|uniref:WAT1-related protein At5g64700 n=1 Tax=Rutidosis leptorrhynchoides TaxID=125765 RepID=UPI003A999DED